MPLLAGSTLATAVTAAPVPHCSPRTSSDTYVDFFFCSEFKVQEAGKGASERDNTKAL